MYFAEKVNPGLFWQHFKWDFFKWKYINLEAYLSLFFEAMSVECVSWQSTPLHLSSASWHSPALPSAFPKALTQEIAWPVLIWQQAISWIIDHTTFDIVLSPNQWVMCMWNVSFYWALKYFKLWAELGWFIADQNPVLSISRYNTDPEHTPAPFMRFFP